MPITKDNLQTALALHSALSQRQDTIRQMATQIASGAIWRSTDGNLAVDFTPAQTAELEAILTDYLNESQTLIDVLRAIVGKPNP
jgi:hypothetical protein